MTGSAARYALLLRHPFEPLIWMQRAADAWTLPSTTAAPKSFRDVEGLDRVFDRVLGCGITVLRYLRYAPSRDARTLDVIVEAEVATDAAGDGHADSERADGGPMIAGGPWLPIERLSAVRITPDVDGVAVASWLADRSRNREGSDGDRPNDDSVAPPSSRMRPGWHAQATSDVGAAIAARGWRMQGPLRLLRTSALGALSRAATSGGDVYLKTIPAAAAHEISISKLLADRFPNRVPEVIAADEVRGWLLLAGVDGEPLPRSSDPAHYRDALRRLAAIQIASTSTAQLDAFRAAGVPDQNLGRLACALASEIPDDLLPAARDGGLLTPAAIETLRRLLPALRGACESLAATMAPAALEHGDCHPHNVIVSRDGCVLLDWSECSIAHPWFSAVAFLAYLDRLRPDLRRLRPSLRDAYLACWAAFGDPAALARAWALAEPLAAMHYALSQHRALRRMRTLPAWEKDEIAAGLRAALTALLDSARPAHGVRALV